MQNSRKTVWLLLVRTTKAITSAVLAVTLLGCSQVVTDGGGREAGACGQVDASAEFAQIRIGVKGFDAPSLVWASDNYCFGSAGLEAKVSELNGVEAVASLASGSLDVIQLNVAELLVFVANGEFDGVVILSSSGYFEEELARAKRPPLFEGVLLMDTVLVTKKDSEINSFGELSGKLVAGLGPDTLVGWALREATLSEGGDPSTLEIINIPQEARIGVLERGDVDAALLSGRFASAAIESGYPVVGYPGAYFFSEGPILVWVTSPRVLEDKPGLISKFKSSITALNTQLRDLEANQESYAQVLIDKFETDPEVAKNTKLSNYWLEQVTVAQLNKMAEKLLRIGAIKAIPDLNQIIEK